MNLDHLRKLRASIEASDTYDQSQWHHDCGSPACLGGHAAVLSGLLTRIIWMTE